MSAGRWSYRLASILALAGVLAHEIVGAPMVLEPLEASSLPPEVIGLHRFSWHVGSVAAITMAGLYAYASYLPGNSVAALAATAMSAGFALLGLGLALFAEPVLWTTPAPYLWTVITLVGGTGLFLGPRSGE